MKYFKNSSARLAQSVEHQTLNLRVVGSSPTLGEAFMKYPFHYSDKIVVKCVSWIYHDIMDAGNELR